MSETLAMFLDEDFDPASYVDAVFNSVLAAQSTSLPSSVYNEKNLHKLQSRCSTLVSHLDFYTNELSSELSGNIEKLKDTSTIVSSGLSYDQVEITRLQFYIKSLTNAVVSLQQEVSGVVPAAQEKASLASDPDGPVEKLTSLKQVKQRLGQVLEVFERINTLLDMSAQSDHQQATSTTIYRATTLDQFTESMDMLQESIRQELADQDFSQINSELIGNIDSLSSMLPLFQGTPFHAVYKRFISRILADKERYLSMRKK
ncbi:conserved oligomeric Golgi complex subunit 7 [[Candida] anglica]|uniref:Conserved oligomeric Golgi complex subunit 7 n=1 Tax=[Candida] anglica TaxID=148631 RepID=A0ABP0EJS3_9ASCO